MDRENSYYHCSSEWHFAQLQGAGAHYASLIYSHSLRLSKKYRRYHPSVPHLADYFGIDQRTVRKAIHHLKYLGFFETLGNERGGDRVGVCYKPLYHGEYEQKFGTGNCVQKLAMPWKEEERDPLGLALYNESGGRFQPWPNLLKGIRNTATKAGMQDKDVLLHFDAFVALEQPTGKRWVNGFAGRFVKYLRNVANNHSS